MKKPTHSLRSITAVSARDLPLAAGGSAPLFDMLKGILEKYDETANSVIQALGR